MRTLKKIITKVNCKYGSPNGRPNKGLRPNDKKTYDTFVPMCKCCGAYDIGGVYWGVGVGRPLRVSYTKDLSYIEFYRSWKIRDGKVIY